MVKCKRKTRKDAGQLATTAYIKQCQAHEKLKAPLRFPCLLLEKHTHTRTLTYTTPSQQGSWCHTEWKMQLLLLHVFLRLYVFVFMCLLHTSHMRKFIIKNDKYLNGSDHFQAMVSCWVLLSLRTIKCVCVQETYCDLSGIFYFVAIDYNVNSSTDKEKYQCSNDFFNNA